MKQVVLVDVMNTAFRSAFAFPDLHNADGKPTGVLYGCLKAVLQLREQIAPDVIFCWDGVPGTHETKLSWRKALLPDYKANRAAHNESQPDLRPAVWSQLKELHNALNLIGVPSFGWAGLEADDVIALLCGRFVNYKKLIFSTDRDMYQLLSGDTVVLKPTKQNKAYRVYTERDLHNEYRLMADSWPAYLVMGGDKSDSIKPQRGMGPKTAIKLIFEQALPALTWKQQQFGFQEKHSKYRDCWDRVNLCYQMALLPRIWTDKRIAGYIPNVTVAATKLAPPDRANADKFSFWCAEYNMNEFLAARWKFFSPTGKLS